MPLESHPQAYFQKTLRDFLKLNLRGAQRDRCLIQAKLTKRLKVDFNQGVQLTIAIGTIAGVVVAFYMSRQTAKKLSEQLKLNFFADYTKRYQEIILNFPENINEEDFSFETLRPEIKEKTLRYMRAYFDLCSEEYFLWKQGNIDDIIWKEWESGIKYAMSKTAFQKAWKDYINISTIYYSDFTKFVNNILENNIQKD